MLFSYFAVRHTTTSCCGHLPRSQHHRQEIVNEEKEVDSTENTGTRSDFLAALQSVWYPCGRPQLLV